MKMNNKLILKFTFESNKDENAQKLNKQIRLGRFRQRASRRTARKNNANLKTGLKFL